MKFNRNNKIEVKGGKAYQEIEKETIQKRLANILKRQQNLEIQIARLQKELQELQKKQLELETLLLRLT